MLLVDTGQHYSAALRDGQYRDLGLRAPDAYLGVGPGDPVEQVAWMAAGGTQVLSRYRPRVVVVVGDTNSTLACAVAASQLGITLVHVEAGLRSGQAGMAEERNRCIVDRLSDVLCAPSMASVEALTREKVRGRVVETGDVARDVLEHTVRSLPASRPAVAPEGPYVLATLHRAELTNDRGDLEGVLRGLGALPLPVLLPLHPRTRAALGADLDVPSRIQLCEPLAYSELLQVLRHASVVVTDSGGVQREAYWSGVPCVTVRTETEWGETVARGANRLVAPGDGARIPEVVRNALDASRDWCRNAYGTGDASARIAGALVDVLVPTRHFHGVTVP